MYSYSSIAIRTRVRGKICVTNWLIVCGTASYRYSYTGREASVLFVGGTAALTTSTRVYLVHVYLVLEYVL